jgi:branched-chain amino acid transport system substrate-binding protein
MRKRLLVNLLVLCLVFTGLSLSQAAAEESYKVGALFSLSGRGAILGEPEKKTVQLIQEQINSEGGINGHPLEVVIYDDESDEGVCVAAFRKMAEQDGVAAVIGPSLSGPSLAVVPLAEEFKLPLIACAASYKIVTANRETGEQYKWVFKTAQSDSLAVSAIYAHMKRRGIRRIAILTEETGFGLSGREELLRLAPAFEISVVAAETYGPRATSMIPQLTRIKRLDRQAIVNWSIGPTQIVVMHNWRDLGMSVIPLYQSHGFGSPRNLALAGNAGEGVYCPLSACIIAPILPDNHPQKKVTMAYWQDYTKKYNEPVSSFGGHAWDAIHLVIDAFKAVGPQEEPMRDYLEYREGFVGQTGVFNFSPIDHNGLTREAFTMVVVRDGKWALAE